MGAETPSNAAPAKAEGAVTPSPTKAPDGPGAGDPQPPPGFKLVKIRKKDGTVVTIRQKIKTEDKSASPAAPATEAATATTPPKPTPAGDAASTQAGTPKYKIVLIPQPDGTLKKVRRHIAQGSDGVSSGPAQPSKAATDKVSLAANTTQAATEIVKKPSDATEIVTGPAEKASHAISDTEQKAAKPEGAQDTVTAEDPKSLQQALDEQKQYMRARKMHGFRQKLTVGLVKAIGSSIPAFEISEDYHDGDEELSDDDWSSDGDTNDDNDHGEDHDALHDSDMHGEEHAVSQDGDRSVEHDEHGSHGGVTFSSATAVNNLTGAIAASAAHPPPRQPPPTTAQRANGSAAEKNMATYNISAKEIAAMDDHAANVKPLTRHWANLTFYVLAGLSIVLPLLFLILAIAVFLMNGKEVNSSWGDLQQAIKVGVSAWPIIFAAVVAQVFKTYATFKVERGIKLMELEQLVGSNSFASAVKQPILLRRIDIISIVLFGTWCLSPLGSSALQRTYSITLQEVNTTSTVNYLNMTGVNRMFNYVAMGSGILEHTNANFFGIWEDISVLYTALLAPQGVSSNDYEDSYNHPKSPWLEDSYTTEWPMSTSGYGVPLLLPDSIFDHGDSFSSSTTDSRSEQVNFVMQSSYFNFTCGGWSVVNGSYFDIAAPEILVNSTFPSSVPCSEASPASNTTISFSDGTYTCPQTVGYPTLSQWETSSSNTSRLRFTYKNPTNSSTQTITALEFASLIKGPGSTRQNLPTGSWPLSGNDSLHSTIQCSFEQIFVEFGVECYRSDTSAYDLADCNYAPTFLPIRRDNNAVGNPGASLYQFSFLKYANPGGGDEGTYPTTPNEEFLGLYPNVSRFDPNGFNLSSLVTPETFSKRMAYLFNTFVDLGNFFEPDTGFSYLTVFDRKNLTDPVIAQNFVPVTNAYRDYTGVQIFALDVAWAAVFLVCVVILLVAGVISVVIESLTVAPDTLGYVSTVARNSKHLHLPKSKVSSAMSGGERAKALGSTVVMMQDVKPGADVGRIALGMKHEKAQKLQPGRLYR